MTLSLVPKAGTNADFLKIFNRLAIGLRDPGDDTGVTQDVYFEALKDLPLPALEQSAAVLLREPGRRFFPTTAEWRGEAEKVTQKLLRDAVRPREQPWGLECHRCEDTGWVMGLTCDGDSTCGREKKHGPHTFTRACPCRPTNRTWQRHQQSGFGAS